MLSKHEELHKNLTCLNIIKNYDKKISDQQIGTAMNLSSTYFQLFSILSNMYTFRSVPLLRFDTKPEKESLKESLTFWEKGSPCKACITLYMYLFESIYKQKCENNYLPIYLFHCNFLISGLTKLLSHLFHCNFPFLDLYKTAESSISHQVIVNNTQRKEKI